MADEIRIAGQPIGASHPPYFIAEVGANHNGDMDLCRQLIDAAATAGADAVKFQSWSADSLLGNDLRQDPVTLAEVRRLSLTPQQHRMAKEHCSKRGVAFCSTPFSNEEVDMLVDLGVPFLKIASMDVTYPQLLSYVARQHLPVVLSTGMASLGEIEAAMTTLKKHGASDIALLHCVSVYPPQTSTVNLRNIGMLQEVFGVPVGYSDHTLGIGCAIGAIAQGACIIEKHFTLNKNMDGWDHAVSAECNELAQIVREGMAVWEALGDSRRIVSADELEKRLAFRRSAVAAHDLAKGQIVSEADLSFKRPGGGIAPTEAPYVLGRRIRHDVEQGEMLTWQSLE